jgi:hypothetical protein
MWAAELWWKLCASQVKISNISINSSYPAFVGTGVLVCGQSIIHNYRNLFKEDYYV